MNLFIIILSGLLVSFFNLAQVKSSDVKPTMHALFMNMQKLEPYMVDDIAFKDKKNEKVIKSSLKEMTELVKNAEHFNTIRKSPTFKISAQAIENHFSEILKIYETGNKDYARWQLNSTVPLCMSCHTQAPSKSRKWHLDPKTNNKLSNFQKAELLFMGRDFDEALEIYDSIINNFPKNKVQASYVEKAMERKVVIFSRVNRNFKEGITSIENNLKNKNLPPYLEENAKAWAALFRIQIRNGFPDPKKANDSEIKKYVDRELKTGLWDDMVEASNPRLVKNLTVSGILYEYLNTNPNSKIKPEILYWLSLCDRQIKENLFYSLADLYLKECMNEYSKNPIAKKCFDEYKENTLLSYTGSAGTDLPEDVKKELDDLAIKVYGKKQKLELE